MIKLTRVEWSVVLGEGPREIGPIWVQPDKIFTLEVENFQGTATLLSYERGAFLVKETPEEILDLMHPPLSEEEKESLRGFGLLVE